jgi:hypothetical protein
MALTLEAPENCIFDRCPADLLAYLLTHRDAHHFELEPWLPRVGSAMERLDLVVFVPIEDPDRVAVGADDHPAWRRRVDAEIRDIVLDDRLGFDLESLEVIGTPSDRVRQVLEWMQRTANG